MGYDTKCTCDPDLDREMYKTPGGKTICNTCHGQVED